MTGKFINCRNCGKSKYWLPSEIKSRACKFCSPYCYHKSTIGRVSPLKGIKNGRIPWNKGNHDYMKGDTNHQWKGDQVGYNALHRWVQRCLGKAFWCTWCFSCINVHWANVSHTYKRDLSDWMQLCIKCHRKYDKGRSDIKLIFL